MLTFKMSRQQLHLTKWLELLHRTLPVPPFHFFDVTDRTLLTPYTSYTPTTSSYIFDVTDLTKWLVYT
jgi:hypothetical protein